MVSHCNTRGLDDALASLHFCLNIARRHGVCTQGQIATSPQTPANSLFFGRPPSETLNPICTCMWIYAKAALLFSFAPVVFSRKGNVTLFGCT